MQNTINTLNDEELKSILSNISSVSENYIFCKPGIDVVKLYSEVKNLKPNGEDLSKDNRISLIFLPGQYILTGQLEVDTSYIDFIGLGSIKKGQGCSCSVFFNKNLHLTETLDDIYIKGIDLGDNAFVIGKGKKNNYIFEDCKAGNNSFGNNIIHLSGHFINCQGKDNCFGGNLEGCTSHKAYFLNCYADNYSFGSKKFCGVAKNCRGGSRHCFGYGSDMPGLNGVAGLLDGCTWGDSEDREITNAGEKTGVISNCFKTVESSLVEVGIVLSEEPPEIINDGDIWVQIEE